MEVAQTPIVQFQNLVLGQILGAPLSKTFPLSLAAPQIVRSIGFTLDMTQRPEEAAVVLQTTRRLPAGVRIAQSLVAH